MWQANLDPAAALGYASRMSEAPETRPEPIKPPSGKRKSSDERLKAALKANMARRKAQAKARAADPSGQGDDRQQRPPGPQDDRQHQNE